jgi:UDP-3-O-[3-hydroxymyristoyl] glucosamine N-acyltransferase
MPEFTVEDLARVVGGTVGGDGTRTVRGVAPVATAGPDDLSFIANARYVPYLHATAAAAVLVPEALDAQVPAALTRIRIADPHAALAELLPLLYPEEPAVPGVHRTAVVHPDAVIGEDVSIDAYAVVERGAQIGARSRVASHCVLGVDVWIGEDCVLHPHVTLYRGAQVGDRCTVHSGARIGADGFGFASGRGGHRKIPQVGGCQIGDDVEIGANTTIDRGSLGDTVIGRGTKIDNLVHIGHNARIGEHVLIVAQVGISGSASIGNRAVLAGQAGIGGHLVIGDGARVAAQAGVIGDVAPGETVSGYPARPHREALRAQAALFRLPRLMRRIQQIERIVPDQSHESE